MRLFAIIVVLSLLIYSCERVRLKSELERLVGCELILNKGLRSTMNGFDTTLTQFLNPDVKMIVLYDSLGCSPCRINHMGEWADAISLSILLKHRFNVIFIVAPKKGQEKQVSTFLKTLRLDYPVYIDSGSKFQKMNPVIPPKEAYHTFLLDKDNRIILVGNPLDNGALWELYKKEIKKRIGVLE